MYIKMESARDLVARRLPPVLFAGRGSVNQSMASGRLPAHLVHLWSTFRGEVLDAVRSLDLSRQVSLTDPYPSFPRPRCRRRLARRRTFPVSQMWRPVLQSIDNGSERFLVGCELGLTTRFVRNICDPVAETLSATRLSNVTFGDIHAVKPAPNCIPDVVLLEASNPRSPTRAERLLSVGELETFWTLPLEEYLSPRLFLDD